MITDIRLRQFRSYDDASFEFDPGVNIIVGPNASGKTNLLESILMVSMGKSYRVKDAELVQHDQPWARIDADTPDGTRTLKIKPGNRGLIEKEFVINGNILKRLSLPKTIPVVLFEPDHLLLLSGSPDARRDYLDGLLEQIVPGYPTLRRQYRRTLAQRNSLLKQGPSAKGQLFAWNIRLSQLGGQVARERLAIVREISERVQDLYRQLSRTKGVVVARYTSGCDTEQYSSDLLYKLEQTVDTDIERGFTGYGPHRDDLVFELNDYLIQETASRGETRTLLLAVKIIEMQLIESHRGRQPIVLLDDVFSELDGARRHALTDLLVSRQTFITTTDADVVAKNFTASAHVIPLSRR